jgi:hypothetical protein
MWFYAQGTNRQGPVPESEIKSLLASGRLAMTDLAWTEGMPNWSALSALPELHPAVAATAPADGSLTLEPPAEIALPSAPEPAVPAANTIPESLPGWLGFIGILNIIGGVISCITCVGAITGIILILSGVALTGARNALRDVTSISPDLVPFFNKLKTFATTTGVLYIVGLVASILFLVFCIVLLSGFASGAGGF